MAINLDREIATRLETAVQIAQEAGDVTLRYFRSADLAVERKADMSPVTIADKEAEKLLRLRIAERFPNDGIVGEEFGTQSGTTNFQWVFDPIDGTKSFIHGVPLYTTLVALLLDNQPVVGVIHAPAASETVYAAKGGGCWQLRAADQSPQPARVSGVSKLSESLLLTTEMVSFARNRRQDALDRFLTLQRTARLARTWGDGYGYLMVAMGRAEIMIDPVVNLWDAAPLQPIIEEAGGQFTDWNGNPTIHAGEAVATNGLVAAEVLAATRSG